MSIAVLYRWRVTAGREAEFRQAWVEGTRLIHAQCRSYGARLHQDAGGVFWSYARWPTDEGRRACFAEHDFFSLPCFVRMQACIAERFDEVVLTLTDDELAESGDVHEVPTLRTERLVLRALRLDDAASLHPALADPDNMHMWSRGPLASVDETRAYIAGNVSGNALQCWAITRAAAVDDALGWVVLLDRRPATAEVGYILRPDAQRNGFAREAVAAVVDYAFRHRQLRRIWADTDPENTGSTRLLEALGFELEGVLRGQWETHIGVRDSAIYAMIAPSQEAP